VQRRANKRRGHGNWDNDRPPMAGVVGRESGEANLEVAAPASRPNLERVVEDNTAAFCMAYTDEWAPYDGLPELGRGHAAVCHAPAAGVGAG
jgi:hypothetical protein